MADSVMDDDLISQDDIDKLMDASDEADGDEPSDIDELGELSQDDIDSLLNSNTEFGEDEDGLLEPSDDDMELISQDDIDSLINAETSGDPGDSQADESDQDMGELSQDDIDSLLNGSDDSEGSPDPLLDTGDDLGELSQDDIDSLLNAPGSTGGDASQDSTDDESDFGELSQEDIDSLMTGSSDEPESTEDDDFATDEASGELSQDDIDNLMNAGDADDLADETNDGGDDAGELSQDDIDGLMGASSAEEPDIQVSSQDDIKNLMSPDAAEAQEPSAEPSDAQEERKTDQSDEAATAGVSEKDQEASNDEWVISDAEAVAAQDCTVTQAALDGLIDDFDPTPDSEPVILDEDIETQEPDLPAESEAQALSQPDGEDQISKADPLQDVLDDDEEDADSSVLDFDATEDEDVTQEDIDALLTEGGDEEDEDILISQDDIDTLLMAADEDDEDVLGDLVDSEEANADLEDAFDDEDFLGDGEAGGGELDEQDDENQVVLEDDDAPVKKKPSQKKVTPPVKAGWYRSKLVIACAAALVLMGITVPIAYFIFSGSDPERPETQTAMQSGQVPSSDGMSPRGGQDLEPAMQTVDVVVQQPVMRTSGNMVLKDFIVLAPAPAREVSYVTLDISIDYSDQRAYHEIQNNLAFYRDLIYDSIRKRLDVTKDQVEVTEADILLVIENTLNKVLPGNYIDRVSFKSFKIS